MTTPEGRGSRIREISAEGYLPGEDVAVAVVIGRIAADLDGTVNYSSDRARLLFGSELILFGTTSGTVAARYELLR